MSDISKGGSAEEAGDPTCKSLKHPRIEKVSLCMLATMLVTMLATMLATMLGRMAMKMTSPI